MILAGQAPLIMIGPPATAPAGRALSDFVRQVRIPFFNTQMGKGAVTGGSTCTWARRPCRARLRASGDRLGRPDHFDRA